MMPKIAPSSKEEELPRAVFSAAQTVGQGHEIPYGYRKLSVKDYADVIVALVCLGVMLGTAYFAMADTNYATAMRVSQTIERVFGHVSGSAIDTRKVIVVVENDEQQRLIAKTALERYGYNVALVDNIAQAGAVFRKATGRVALVVLDSRNGSVQAVRQIKGIRPSVPVLVSGPASDKLQAGMSARIDSPFAALPLAEAVQKTLRGRAL